MKLPKEMINGRRKKIVYLKQFFVRKANISVITHLPTTLGFCFGTK